MKIFLQQKDGEEKFDKHEFVVRSNSDKLMFIELL